MNEKQLAQQLRKLSQIKPDEQWKNALRADLLETNKDTQQHEGFFVFQFFRAHHFAGSAIALSFVALCFSAWFLRTSQEDIKVAYQAIEHLTSQVFSEQEQNKNIIASMDVLKDNLGELKTAIQTLKTTENKSQALAMAETIKGALKSNGETVAQIKKTNGSIPQKTLASLNEIEEISFSLEQESGVIQEQILNEYLQDLKTRILSSQDKENLNKAEEYLQEGKSQEAMIFLMKIGN